MILSTIAYDEVPGPSPSCLTRARRSRGAISRHAAVFLAAFMTFFPPFQTSLFAQTPPILPETGSGAPTFSTLPNGMEVILLPIPGSKSVSLSIVFRGGADVQTSKNAGLFRLLEQVLFRGTAASPGEPEPAGATEALGAASIGGGTGADRFSLSFLIAPDVLSQGLDTIVYLFSGMRLETAFTDPLALEEARSAVLLDINTAYSDPSIVFDSAMSRKLFASAPWRLDTIGADYIANAATEDSLRSLASTWLVPNNAALVVTGDFPSEAVTPMIEKAFSSWKKAADPWKSPPAVFPKPGITRPTLVVYPDPSVDNGEAAIEMRYRGPDSGSLRSAAAALWSEMASRPDSRLAQAVRKGMPKWSAPSSIEAHYEMSRSSSWFSVSAMLALDPKASIAESAMTFKEIVRGAEMYAMKTNPGYFLPKDYEQAKGTITGDRVAKLTDPREAGVLIADGWILGGKAWLESWSDRVTKISSKDITQFADEYFMKNLEIVSVRLSPNDYASRKKSFDSYGFELITQQKAFWWR